MLQKLGPFTPRADLRRYGQMGLLDVDTFWIFPTHKSITGANTCSASKLHCSSGELAQTNRAVSPRVTPRGRPAMYGQMGLLDV